MDPFPASLSARLDKKPRQRLMERAKKVRVVTEASMPPIVGRDEEFERLVLWKVQNKGKK